MGGIIHRIGDAPATGLSFIMHIVLYDGLCGFCQRSLRILQRLDWRHIILPRDVAGDWPALSSQFPTLDRDACLREMHTIDPAGRIRGGFDALRRLSWALPPLWPIAPLLYVPPVPTIGRRIYRFVAARRATGSCKIA